jgi:hypothetical protein
MLFQRFTADQDRGRQGTQHLFRGCGSFHGGLVKSGVSILEILK